MLLWFAFPLWLGYLTLLYVLIGHNVVMETLPKILKILKFHRNKK
jgi:hypothetical protein